MFVNVKNTQAGPRGFSTVGGEVMIPAGATVKVEFDDKRDDGNAKAAQKTGWFEFSGDDDDDDDDGTPALDRMKRDDLVALAAEEGAEHDEKATRAEIIEAIEAKRAEGAGA